MAGLDRNGIGVNATLGITGIQHVSINVDHLDAALEFYVDRLGLVPLPRPDIGIPGAWLDAPNGVQVHLIELPGAGSSANHFALDVLDIDAAIAILRASGVTCPDWTHIGTGRQVFLKDPSGNVVELNQAGDRTSPAHLGLPISG